MASNLRTWPPKEQWEAELPAGPPLVRLQAFVAKYKHHNRLVSLRQRGNEIIEFHEKQLATSDSYVMLSDAYHTLKGRMQRKGVV